MAAALNETHAALFFPGSDPKEALSLLRQQVIREGGIARTRERHEREEIRKARKEFQKLRTSLRKIERLTRRIPKEGDRDAIFAADLSVGIKSEPVRSVIPTIIGVIESVRHLREAISTFENLKSPRHRLVGRIHLGGILSSGWLICIAIIETRGRHVPERAHSFPFWRRHGPILSFLSRKNLRVHPKICTHGSGKSLSGYRICQPNFVSQMR